MLELMEEDQSAYEALDAARSCRRIRRSEADVAAAATCIAAFRKRWRRRAWPSSVWQISSWTMANRHLLSDLAVCAELAMATTRAAIYNVRVNLPDISDAEQRRKIERTSEELLVRREIDSARHAEDPGEDVEEELKNSDATAETRLYCNS